VGGGVGHVFGRATRSVLKNKHHVGQAIGERTGVGHAAKVFVRVIFIPVIRVPAEDDPQRFAVGEVARVDRRDVDIEWREVFGDSLPDFFHHVTFEQAETVDAIHQQVLAPGSERFGYRH
jgi:hypothetical protein